MFSLSPTCTLGPLFLSFPDVTLLMIRYLHNLFKTLDLPSGEGALTTFPCYAT